MTSPVPPSGWTPTVLWPGEKPLLTLLKAGYELLQPPSPLPTDAAQLQVRLERSLAVISKTQQHDERLWQFCLSNDDAAVDIRCQVVDRCIVLLWSIQKVLELEYLPMDQRRELQPSDFLLGTADLRLLRTMVDLLIGHLYDLTQALAPKLASIDVNTTTPWLNTISLLFSLAASPTPMDDSRAIPPTAIAQYIQLHYLPHICLSTILLGWAPTFPPHVFQALRAKTQDILVRSGNKVVVLRTMWAVIRLTDGKGGQDKTGAGWSIVWPGYAKSTASKMVDMIIAAPGGVRALIYGIIGEEAVLAKRPPSEKDILMLCGMVSMKSGTRSWTHNILHQIYHFIAPPPTSRLSPTPAHPTHVYAACRLLESFWQKRTADTSEWIQRTLFEPISLLTTKSPFPESRRVLTLMKAVVDNVAQQSDFVTTAFAAQIPAIYNACETWYRMSARPTSSDTARARMVVMAQLLEDLLVSWVERIDGDASFAVGIVSTSPSTASSSTDPQFLLADDVPAPDAYAHFDQNDSSDELRSVTSDLDTESIQEAVRVAQSGTLLTRILSLAGRTDLSKAQP